jgi:hypothetical protein
VRLVLLCQPATDISKRLTEVFPKIRSFDITTYSKTDIEQYISKKVLELIQSNPALSSEKETIINHLQQEASGMFQWVNACIESLEDELVSASDVNPLLESLHPGLNSTYRRVFERFLTKNDLTRGRVRSAVASSKSLDGGQA